MNNEWVISQAKALAARLTGSDEAKVTQVYRLLLQRTPEKKEAELALGFLRSAGEKAWREYAQVLMTSNEFQFVD